MTTINDIEDLVRILRERPDWLKTVRELVLSEELLRLPETVAQLAEELREYARRADERLDRLETTVAQLSEELREYARRADERLDRLETTVAQLSEELREYARRTDERLARLETDMAEVKADMVEVKADVAEVKADMAEVKADMVEVKAEQAQTNRRLARVENQINDLRGDTFEITAARRIMPELFRQASIYNCETVLGPGMSMTREMLNDIRQAQSNGIVERNSVHEIAYADLVLHGLRDDDDQPVWIVIEASVKIDEHDITRARQRADILAAVYEEPALAVVAGESIDDRDRARAEDAGVAVIILRPRYRPEE